MGVFIRFLDFYSLFGGYKILRPEFVPVYQICTPPGRSDCGCEAEIGSFDFTGSNFSRNNFLVSRMASFQGSYCLDVVVAKVQKLKIKAPLLK